MPEFLVIYEEPRLIVTVDRLSFYEQEGHTLVIQAENEVKTFIAAYDYLTRRGHLVRTMKPCEGVEDLRRYAEQRWLYGGDNEIVVVAGLSLEQMEEVYEAGVPVIGGSNDTRRMTVITTIEPYQVHLGDAVVSG